MRSVPSYGQTTLKPEAVATLLTCSCCGYQHALALSCTQAAQILQSQRTFMEAYAKVTD